MRKFLLHQWVQPRIEATPTHMYAQSPVCSRKTDALGRPMRAKDKSCVVSCRVPNELKTALDTLARERSVMLSHVMREFLEEAVRCGDLYHWKEPESVPAQLLEKEDSPL
ncbi:hypothetical protein [Sutterella sp.]|uniref:hypothetical protein n=1 Tax=Sutterella sp. TaxID=1981025 RepID=UPI003FD7B230